MKYWKRWIYEQFMWIIPKYHVNEDSFEEVVESSTATDESDSSNSRNHSIKYKWMTINGKASKDMVSLAFSDILETVKEKINELKYHLYIRNEHRKIYKNLKLQIPDNVIFVRVDYT